MKRQKPIILIQEQESWLQVEDVIRNTVVQVFAQIVRFNWLEPYKIEEEFEQRATGFFISDTGEIVTNAHVVDQAKRIWIEIPAIGRRNIHAEVIGFCPDRDLALLRIGHEDLEWVKKELGIIPFLSLGDSDLVRRTDKVLVLGYPLGQLHVKSSTGIISGREFVEGITLLQITAPVNPGNSGGPLLNVYGQVIGVTIASVPEASNVGYAIPINELALVIDDLRKNTFVRKNILGLRFNVVHDLAAQWLGNPVPAGAYINGVFQDSLAERIGIEIGDMLYMCNGYRVDSFLEVAVPWSEEKIPFHDLIDRLHPSESVVLELYRAGTQIKKQFTFESSNPYPVRTMYPDYEPISYEVIAGIVFMELAENHLPLLMEIAPHLEQFQRMEYKQQATLVITQILPGSLAQQLRSLSPGDTIKEVNGMQVTSLEMLRAALTKGTETDFLVIKTTSNILAVFSYHQVLAEEERLAHDYGYPISPTIDTLRRKINNGSKKET